MAIMTAINFPCHCMCLDDHLGQIKGIAGISTSQYQAWPSALRGIMKLQCCVSLTHWGRVMHICVGILTIIASDNGLSPGRRQAIIWNNAGILSTRLLGTYFSEILIEILIFSFKKMRLKVSSAKWRPFCLGLSVLNPCIHVCKHGITNNISWFTMTSDLFWLNEIISNILGPFCQQPPTIKINWMKYRWCWEQHMEHESQIS